MICRGGIVVGGWGDVAPPKAAAPAARPSPLETLAAGRRPLRWSLVFVSVVTVALALAALPGRTRIAPLLESDYCYLLTAADRLHNGQGLTATQPVAPSQPWEWQYDWGFLTQWPAGYPLLVAGLRKAIGVSTIDACRWIGLFACAAALVGWFVWIRRSVPGGGTGVLLAAVGAGSCATVGSLTNPSTDALLIAVLPYILLLLGEARCRCSTGPDNQSQRREIVCLAAAGLLAGGLFWIRYASVFVPFAIALYLLTESRRRRPAGLRRRVVTPSPPGGGGLFTHALSHLLVFGTAAALPIVALLLLNRALGQAQSATAQLNLGSGIGFDFSWAKLAQAWWMFTGLGFYDHRPAAHWLYATWPFVLMIAAVSIRPIRASMRALLDAPAIRLGACLVVALLGMLLAATTLFGSKFDYVGLDRYYLPVRPLYFLLFLTPLMMIPRRALRAILCVGLLIAGSWIVRQDWARTYTRLASAERPMTPYGAWSRCFEPGAGKLYAWLSGQNDPRLIVISNFHEYVALETGIPALPIPPNREALDEWISRIGASRGVTHPRVLFVLDPDNKWRSHWITPPETIIREFDLVPSAAAPGEINKYLFEPNGEASVVSAE